MLTARAEYARAQQVAGDSSLQAFAGSQGLPSGWITELSGDLERADELFELVPDYPPYSHRGALGFRSRVLLGLGRVEAARRVLEEWERELVSFSGGGPTTRSGILVAADEALLQLASEERVRSTYEFLLAPHIRISLFGTVDHFLGRLALRLELPLDQADQHFREGLEWCDREQCPVEAGRNLQGLAEVAERRGKHSKAMEYLDAAAAKFAEYGAKLYLVQVLAKKSVLGA